MFLGAFWSEPTELTFHFIRNGDSYAGFNLHLGHLHLLSVKVFEVISITQAYVGDWVRCYATCQHVWNNLTFKYNSISLLITYLPLQSNSIVYPPHFGASNILPNNVNWLMMLIVDWPHNISYDDGHWRLCEVGSFAWLIDFNVQFVIFVVNFQLY